jgi:Fe-S cluster biogenesis protein NfuA
MVPNIAGRRVSRPLNADQRRILKRVSAAHVGGRDLLARNRRRIETVLDRIRPMLRADGLDVEVVDVWRHGASVLMAGASSTWCKGASLNFHTDVEAALRRNMGRFEDLRLV